MNHKSIDTYLDLCTQVYDSSKPVPPKDEWDFYLSYAREAHGSILEPMCGSGCYLLPLLAEGFDIHGFDASQSMLDALHAKAKAQNLVPDIWHGYMEQLQTSKKYALIFIPSGSFGLMTDLETIKQSLKNIYEHLEKDGVFVFEVETQQAVPELNVWRGSRWRISDGKTILLSQLATMNGSICHSIGKYELVHDNQIVKTEVEEYEIRIYNDPSLLLDLLPEVGFSNVKLLKAFSRYSSPGENDETLIYECQK